MKSLIFQMMLLLVCSGKILAQNSDYPKKVILGGDTLVIITMSQVDSLNITYNTLEQYKELNDSLKVIIVGYEYVIETDEDIINRMKTSDYIKDKIIEEKDKIIEEERLDKEKTEKKLKRSKFLNKIFGGLATGLTIVAAILSIS